MLIFIGADYEEANLSPDQIQAHMQKWYAWVQELQERQIYVEGRPLTPAAKRVSGKKPVATDGPFAESKELVGGYFIIRAESLEAASEIAKNCPDFEFDGVVEVREVQPTD